MTPIPSSVTAKAVAAGLAAFAVASRPLCAAAAAAASVDRPDPSYTESLSGSTVSPPTWIAFDENDNDTGNSSMPLESGDYDLNTVYHTHLAPIVAFSRYATILWYAIGYPGNLMAFYVWIQRTMRQSSGCYLAALAAADFLFLLLHVVFELQTAWSVSVLGQPGLCEAYPIFFYTTQYLSPLLVLAFTVERYISICHPFRREQFCTTRRAVIVITSLCIGSMVLHSVQGYFWKYSSEPIPVCDVRAEVLATVWETWSYVTELAVFLVVPIIIFCLNIRVIVSARQVEANERSLLNSSNSSQRLRHSTTGRSVFTHRPSVTTVTLLVVSFYHIATTLPVTAVYVVYKQFPEGNYSVPLDAIPDDPVWRRHLSYYSIKLIIEELGMTHYAGNIIIYLLTGAKFRQELRRILLLRFSCLLPASSKSADMTSSRTVTRCCGLRKARLQRLSEASYRFSRTESVVTSINCRTVRANGSVSAPVTSLGHRDGGDEVELQQHRDEPIRTGNGYHHVKIAVAEIAVTLATVTEDDIKRDPTGLELVDVKHSESDFRTLVGGEGGGGSTVSVDDIKRDDDYIRRDSGCVTLDATDDSRRDSDDIKRDVDDV